MKSLKSTIIIIAILLFSTSLCAQNQNISSGLLFDGEPFLSINPTDPSHLVVAWMGWKLFSQLVIKTKVSFDGGQSWSAVNNTPHVSSTYTSADPSLGFDGSGNVYLCYIDFNTSVDSGAVYVRKSTDGGLNWGSPTVVIDAQTDPGKLPIDRPWMVIDRSGSITDGNIYVTTMPPNVFGPVPPPYNPYLIRSTDGGVTFSWKHMDDTGWLAGSLIPQPMPTPAVSADGTFHAVYPSYVSTQNIFLQYIHASSSDAGDTFTYNTLFATATVFSDSLAKKAFLLRANPADANHLVFLYLGIDNGDADVMMRESFNAGVSWSSATRINDDPIGNDRMQDLVWADFDTDGDLIITWRDRRNGTNSTYATAAEIWGAIRWKDSSNFSANFKLSDAIVAYDTILASSGNDFMCVKFLDDTINVVWGDTRSGKLNIWFQRIGPNGMVASIQQLSSETIPEVRVYPNPSSGMAYIELLNYATRSDLTFEITDINGRIVLREIYGSDIKRTVDLSSLNNGLYQISIYSNEGSIAHQKLILR